MCLQITYRCRGFLKLKIQSTYGPPVAFVDFRVLIFSVLFVLSLIYWLYSGITVCGGYKGIVFVPSYAYLICRLVVQICK